MAPIPEVPFVLSLSLFYPSVSPSASHNDFALKLRKLYDNRLSQIDLHNVSELSTDISRLRSGHVRAQVPTLTCFHTQHRHR